MSRGQLEGGVDCIGTVAMGVEAVYGQPTFRVDSLAVENEAAKTYLGLPKTGMPAGGKQKKAHIEPNTAAP